MRTLSTFPYFPLQFDKGGHLHDATALSDLHQHLKVGGTTDLVVISHGWNNDMVEAESFYGSFFTNAGMLIAGQPLSGAFAGRKLAVLGVLWPSKKFAETDLIPSGAASVDGTLLAEDVQRELQTLRSTFDAPDAEQRLDRLAHLLPKLEDSSQACAEFAEQLRGLVRPDDCDSSDASTLFFTLPAGELFDRLKQQVMLDAPAAQDDGGAAAIGQERGAASLGDFFTGALAAARNALNYTTYYQMKARAGLVGACGMNPILRDLHARFPVLRLHLVGHSFGGRLVTAAAAGTDATTVARVQSMSLLQAAFSHYGFAQRWDGTQDGVFRRVLTSHVVAGPIIVTCTRNDKAVGKAYPIASLVARQVGEELGDAHDKYGGIGRNGALATPEAQDATLLPPGDTYNLSSEHVHNLHTDTLIQSHGDVHNPAVVHAVLSAISVK